MGYINGLKSLDRIGTVFVIRYIAPETQLIAYKWTYAV